MINDPPRAVATIPDSDFSLTIAAGGSGFDRVSERLKARALPAELVYQVNQKSK